MVKMDMRDLWKIGEAGVNKASEALKKFTGNEVDVKNLSTRLIKVETISKFFDPDEVVTCIYMPIYGNRQGCSLVIFDMESAQRLIEIMMKKIGTTTITAELYESSLKEIANIMAGSFLTAMANMSEIKLVEGTPTYSKAMIGALIEHIISDFTQKQNDEAMSIEVGFFIKNVEITGHLYVIFEKAMIEV